MTALPKLLYEAPMAWFAFGRGSQPPSPSSSEPPGHPKPQTTVGGLLIGAILAAALSVLGTGAWVVWSKLDRIEEKTGSVQTDVAALKMQATLTTDRMAAFEHAQGKLQLGQDDLQRSVGRIEGQIGSMNFNLDRIVGEWFSTPTQPPTATATATATVTVAPTGTISPYVRPLYFPGTPKPTQLRQR